ncbi:MAG: hypothetical protein SGI71_13120 [Verrucomicrobiota bacterium]|nr:hypothetical protein [Verrucomicrobiota bacterium]
MKILRVLLVGILWCGVQSANGQMFKVVACEGKITAQSPIDHRVIKVCLGQFLPEGYIIKTSENSQAILHKEGTMEVFEVAEKSKVTLMDKSVEHEKVTPTEYVVFESPKKIK